MSSTILSVVGVLIAVVLFIPLSYTYFFVIAASPHKIGYLKFAAIAFCDIVLFTILIFLLSAGYINFLLVIIVAFVIDLLGVYYLKEEFAITVKRDLKMFRKGRT